MANPHVERNAASSPANDPDSEGWRAKHAMSDAEFESFFRSHSPAIGRFLAQIVSSRWLADDLMQETFLTAWRDREQLGGIENQEAWLFGIARNRALHALRGRKRAWNALQRLARERSRTSPDPADAAEVRDYLQQHLTPENRVLLVLRYVHGFDSNELGEIVGRSSEAVRQQLSRARKGLLEGLGETPPTKRPPNHYLGD